LSVKGEMRLWQCTAFIMDSAPNDLLLFLKLRVPKGQRDFKNWQRSSKIWHRKLTKQSQKYFKWQDHWNWGGGGGYF
jgi:hypothetical protein